MSTYDEDELIRAEKLRPVVFNYMLVLSRIAFFDRRVADRWYFDTPIGSFIYEY